METYTVKITGDISEYQQREDAIAAFAKLFSIPMAQAENTINKAPIAIKKGITLEKADQFKEALIGIGVECIVISSARENDVVEATARVVESEATSAIVSEVSSAEESTDESTEENVVESAVEVGMEAGLTEAQESADEEAFRGLSFTIDGDPDYGFVTVQLPAMKRLKLNPLQWQRWILTFR